MIACSCGRFPLATSDDGMLTGGVVHSTSSCRTVALAPVDPLVETFEQAVVTAERGRFEDDIAAVAPVRDRLSAVLAAARSVLVAGPHSDLAVEIEAIRTSLAAADGAR